MRSVMMSIFIADVLHPLERTGAALTNEGPIGLVIEEVTTDPIGKDVLVRPRRLFTVEAA
jgi:hypothetical protein